MNEQDLFSSRAGCSVPAGKLGMSMKQLYAGWFCLALTGAVICLSRPGHAAGPQHDRAWLGRDGIRAAWVGYKVCTDEFVEAMTAARVNTVILKYGLHDLLDLESARWSDGRIDISLRDTHLDRLLENTARAARAGVHVLWMANYELDSMLPHLQRLEYQPANVEGPTRFIREGSKLDASPFDRTLWRGIMGRHGELVAELSLKHPIEASLFDAEHYGGGIM